MNRRIFTFSGLAALVLGSKAASSHQAIGGDQRWVSEFTGATFTWDSSMWFLNGIGITDDGWEMFNLTSAMGSLYVRVVPEDLVAPEEVSAQLVADIKPENIVSADDFADGGYATIYQPPQGAPFGQVGYREYQLGAFPGYDLQIRFWSREDHFADTFPKAQDVDLAGGPPFLFVVESGVGTLDIAGLSGSGETESTPTSRSSGSRNSTEASQTSQDSTSDTSPEQSGEDFVASINTHRDTFIESFDVFYDHLLTLGDLNDDEKLNTLTIMVNIALKWQPYPSQAAKLTPPAGMDTLATLYLSWADHIGEMGFLFEKIYMGTDVTDDFVKVTTSWEGIDLLLETELDKHLSSATAGVAIGMATLPDRVKNLAIALDHAKFGSDGESGIHGRPTGSLGNVDNRIGLDWDEGAFS